MRGTGDFSVYAGKARGVGFGMGILSCSPCLSASPCSWALLAHGCACGGSCGGLSKTSGGRDMRKLILAVLAVVLLLPSAAFSANFFEKKNHKNWNSFIVQDEYGSFMRMVTSGGNGIFLSIDFYPNYNIPQESYSICVLLYDENLGNLNKNIQITGNIRVDKKNIYNIICTIKTDTNIIYNYIKGELSPYIFKDSIEGNTLRIKFNFDDPTIFKFSLLGFTEAFNRCMQMISIMRNEYNKDEDYFKK